MKQAATTTLSLLIMLAGAIILEPAPDDVQDYVGVALVCFGWGIGLASVVVGLIVKWAQGK